MNSFKLSTLFGGPKPWIKTTDIGEVYYFDNSSFGESSNFLRGFLEEVALPLLKYSFSRGRVKPLKPIRLQRVKSGDGVPFEVKAFAKWVSETALFKCCDSNGGAVDVTTAKVSYSSKYKELCENEAFSHSLSFMKEVKRMYLSVKGWKGVLLLGRDTFFFALDCARRGIPFVWIPCVSREVATWLGNTLQWHKIINISLAYNHIWVDTGFVGSVFNEAKKEYSSFQGILFSASDYAEYASFPGYSRMAALAIENFHSNASFWNSGYVHNDLFIIQEGMTREWPAGLILGSIAVWYGDLDKKSARKFKANRKLSERERSTSEVDLSLDW